MGNRDKIYLGLWGHGSAPMGLTIHIVSSRLFKCSLTMANKAFVLSSRQYIHIHLYSPERQQKQVKKAPDTQQQQNKKPMLGCANEAVILQLIRSKCLPALLYGLEACPLRNADSNSLDFYC